MITEVECVRRLGQLEKEESKGRLGDIARDDVGWLAHYLKYYYGWTKEQVQEKWPLLFGWANQDS